MVTWIHDLGKNIMAAGECREGYSPHGRLDQKCVEGTGCHV
jgi:hypothetical protein